MQNGAIRSNSKKHREPYRAATHKAELNAGDEFILAVATKMTNSPEEAAAAVTEMRRDISACATGGISPKPEEGRIVAAIAWRRLLEFLR